MFVLDTNILSAVMGPAPDPQAGAWIAARPLSLLFTTASGWLRFAPAHNMPEEQRRGALSAAARAMFGEDFAGRVLAFGVDAAALYADLFAARRRAGRSGATADLMIAAIARVQGASMVTRDAGGFDGCGLTVINPWVTH